MRYCDISKPLLESLSAPVPFSWQDHSNEDMKLLHASFQIGDGMFIVEFKNLYYNPGYWVLQFVRNDSLDLSGSGNAHRVLSTVLAATREFISTYDPKILTYSAANAEPSRLKLYPKLMIGMMKEFPQYRETTSTTRSYTSYRFERPDCEITPAPRVDKKLPEPSEPMTDAEWDEVEAWLERQTACQ